MQFLRSVAECAFALRLSKNDLFCHSERMRRILARLKKQYFQCLQKILRRRKRLLRMTLRDFFDTLCAFAMFSASAKRKRRAISTQAITSR